MRQDLIKTGTILREEAEKSLNIAQCRFKTHHNHRSRSGSILKPDNYMYRDRHQSFRLAAELSAAGDYRKLLSRTQ